LAPGCDEVYAPGELEASTERRYAQEGIPLNDETVDGLARCGESLQLGRELRTVS
jgi:LDH2 family malate/lactate/ureidoglycolate dehydrogenase